MSIAPRNWMLNLKGPGTGMIMKRSTTSPDPVQRLDRPTEKTIKNRKSRITLATVKF